MQVNFTNAQKAMPRYKYIDIYFLKNDGGQGNIKKCWEEEKGQ